MKINKETFIVSDTHLGHKNILNHCKSRVLNMKFKKYTDHEKWIRDNWNFMVKNENTLLHLGDLSFKGNVEVIKGLNGDKYLLKGNHEDLKEIDYLNNGFKSIDNHYIQIEEFKNDKVFLDKIKELKKLRVFNFVIADVEGFRILFSHFPIVDTDGYDARYAEQIAGLKWIFDYCECDYNIHGHTHENLMKDSRCINVSIENIRFKPIKLEEIIKSRMKKS